MESGLTFTILAPRDQTQAVEAGLTGILSPALTISPV